MLTSKEGWNIDLEFLDVSHKRFLQTGVADQTISETADASGCGKSSKITFARYDRGGHVERETRVGAGRWMSKY